MAQLPRLAAVDVGPVEEGCAAWEDALDIDDSDLRHIPASSSLPLRPRTAAADPDTPSRHSHGQRIPGPASAFQDAMRLRGAGASPVLGRADAQDADADFLLHPWLRALQFLGKDRAWERPGIKRIKADRELHRAPLVVGVVTSCKPNGLGDLVLMLKDPTDSVGATVHRKVLLEGNLGQDISVGCVLVLVKVAVFRPSHSSCYLNITKGKVVKVVRKDCSPSFKQDISSGTIESQLSGNFDEVSCDHQRTRDSSNIISTHKSSIGSDEHSRRSFNILNTCSQPSPGVRTAIPDDRAGTQASNNVKSMLPFADELMLPRSKKLKSNVLPDWYDAMMNTVTDTKTKHVSENNMDIGVPDMAEPCLGRHSSTSNSDEHRQTDFQTENTGTARPNKERSATDAAGNNGLLPSHPKTAISVAPLAGLTEGWTDEQITEMLFADY